MATDITCFGPEREIIPKTKCRHKKGTCDKCGTSDDKDVIHSTKGGNGKIAKLTKKKKK
jgi:hypothetical protein